MNLLRKETIGKYIQEKGAVTVKELGALFPEVSLMTIHRDLEKLEREGVITRTRGGAIAVTQGSSPERSGYAVHEAADRPRSDVRGCSYLLERRRSEESYRLRSGRQGKRG